MLSSHQRVSALCTLSLVGFLALRSRFCAAVHASQLFQPLLSKYSEIRAMEKDESVVASLREKMLSNSTVLQHETASERSKKFYDFHLPTYWYIKSLFLRHRKEYSTKPLFVGISAPQGCGKTTLTNILCELFAHENMNCIAMSIDDFYLTGAQQEQMSADYAHNDLLEFRGNAGTHDLNLALTTLQTIMMLKPDNKGQIAYIPRYNKSLRQGRGDRADKAEWQPVQQAVDIVLVEGWMFGFNPLNHINTLVKTKKFIPKSSLEVAEATSDVAGSTIEISTTRKDTSSVDGVNSIDGDTVQEPKEGKGETGQEEGVEAQEEEMVEVEVEEEDTYLRNIAEINELMRPYEALNWFMDAWLVLALPTNSDNTADTGAAGTGIDTNCVLRWRLQQEKAMRSAGRDGLTDEQVGEFVSRFLPAYNTYLPDLYENGPQRKPHAPLLKVTVGDDRLPIKDVECL